MANRILLATALLTFLFVSSAGVIMGFSVIAGRIRNSPTPVDGIEAARHLTYQRFPLEAGIANAALMFVTFLLILPGLLTPTRTLLKIGGVAISVCGVFTLCIGLFLWIITLDTKATFFPIWKGQESNIQGLMETSVCLVCCSTSHLILWGRVAFR